MSNIGLIIPERAANIGNFLVGRLIPFRQKRSIGPFVFIDHMGPACLKDHENLDVPPHPHIGLSTLTYLFDGAITHRDSLGNHIDIQPGAVNWMTAGKGIAHSVRTPSYLRHEDKFLHGLQIWIALPKHLEDMAPSFAHFEADTLPIWQENDVQFKLIAGEMENRKSPIPVYSRLYMLEIKSEKTCKVNLANRLFGESGLYIVTGGVSDGNNNFKAGQILIAQDAHLCNFEIEAGSSVYIFGGEAFPEERFIYWNFVSSDKSKIEQAKKDWAGKKFAPVPGDDGYVPLPKDS